MHTSFPPTDRSGSDELAEQVISINASPVMDTLLKAAAGLLLVINEKREIVSINHSFLEALGIPDVNEVLGLRMGESLACIHAKQAPDGCGSTKYCATCGASIALMSAVIGDKPLEQVCALTAVKDGVTHDLALLIKAHPLVLDGRRWILVYAQDISKQQLLEEFESALLYDVSGSMINMLANSQLLVKDLQDNKNVFRLARDVTRVYSEILMLRRLYLGKAAEMAIVSHSVTLQEIRNELLDIINSRLLNAQVTLTETWPAADLALQTDITLLTRVIIHMLLNAIEATEPGGEITLTVTTDETGTQWAVWNRGEIPAAVQLRVFQKYFSTKSKRGRGLGTYAMKLFGETYLKGKVTFESTAEAGTTFNLTVPY